MLTILIEVLAVIAFIVAIGAIYRLTLMEVNAIPRNTVKFDVDDGSIKEVFPDDV